MSGGLTAQQIAENMLRDVYESEKLLRQAAEQQLGEWRDLVRRLAQWIDAERLDDMVVQRKEPFTPQEYDKFFREAQSRMSRSRLWGYSYDAARALEARVAELDEQKQRLMRELGEQQKLAEAERTRAEALAQEVAALRERLVRFLGDSGPTSPAPAPASAVVAGPSVVVAPSAVVAAPSAVVAGPTVAAPSAAVAAPSAVVAAPTPFPPLSVVAGPALGIRHPTPFDGSRKKWPPPLRGEHDAYIIWLIGSLGWSLRTRLTSALAEYIREKGGRAQSTSGNVKRHFAYLDGSEKQSSRPPLLEREAVQVTRLHLVFYALSEAGRTVYRRAFDADGPVESE